MARLVMEQLEPEPAMPPPRDVRPARELGRPTALEPAPFSIGSPNGEYNRRFRGARMGSLSVVIDPRAKLPILQLQKELRQIRDDGFDEHAPLLGRREGWISLNAGFGEAASL